MNFSVKKILLLFLFLSNISLVNAQKNEQLAKIEFSMGEEAYSTNNFSKAIEHLNRSEEFIDSWKPRIAYLRILSYDKIVDYNTKSYSLYCLKTDVEQYLSSQSNEASDGSLEKLRDVYNIDQKIKSAMKISGVFDWKNYNDLDFKNAQKEYEVKKYSLALEYFTKSAEKGNDEAMVMIGDLHRFGEGVSQSWEESTKWYQKAAEKGNGEAMLNIGLIYLKGIGVSQDFSKALEWLSKAVEKGNSAAMGHIGVMYFEGVGVSKDNTKGMEWLLKSAEKGNSAAMKNVGNIYYSGSIVKQDSYTAMQWYLKAAEKGDVEAMFYIGNLYLYGLGASQDFLQAMQWFLKAAEKGEVNAMGLIGSMHSEGLGVLQDYNKAMEWFLKAAENGNDGAMRNNRIGGGD